MPKTKQILKGNEARQKIKAGVVKAFEAVAPTLGPVGMTALIEFKGLDPVLCDDGVTILRNLEFSDPYENMGLQMLRKAALRTSTEGGDGTATTTVLTNALVSEAFKEVGDDSTKIREVAERLSKGLVETLEALKKLKRDVNPEDIEKIATISSLDTEVAKLIAEVIKDVGINGVVTVEKGSKLGYTKEVVKGARFEKGLISPYFINDHENKQTVLLEPYIILIDRRVSTNEQILPLLNSIGTGKSILFIADDVDGVALATLAQNAVNGIAQVACVRNPFSASRGRDFLFDIAALTGATVISEESGMRLEAQTVKVCGRAEKVVVTRDTTTIIGGTGDSTLRVTLLQNELNNSVSEFDKNILEERIAQLTGGIGVIRVGAYTDTEFNAKKYKFENAINATQAALQEGILPGGGSALASLTISEPMFDKALKAPMKQMCINSGYNPKKAPDYISGYGVNFKTKEVVNMFDSGVIDPFKVTRLALESAVSITQNLLTVETAIVAEETIKNEQQ